MTTRTRFAFVLAAVVLLNARAARADEVRDAVEAGNENFIAAYLAEDAQAIAQLYTETAEVIAPGAPVARGRAAIADFWKAGFAANPPKSIQLETREVESAGDLAVELGTVKLGFRDGSTQQARYLVVWKREGGSWRLHRDIWNPER
jgi:uncharacterized protein (TIGR02246 family)